MSKKNKKNQEPWSRRFGEDENYSSRQYSRSARKSTKKEVAPLSNVLLFLFLALLIIPFATYYWSEMTKSNPEPKTPDQVMVSKQESSSKAEESERDSLAAEEDESRREESSVETPASTEPEESTVAPEETEEEEEPVASTEPEESKPVEDPATENDAEYTNTYTIQAGDNLFRIALNHGMTLEELKTVNGLSTDVAEIGVVLKVK